ncbi:hypothetical protein VNI00_006699 [Paramarasmius palmivorus]|uniref:HNH nuclease domain-containing protein n=1 Tax=Paramarasmius palmivorus TaxID=297713 RepID=A0AAW0D7F7_9AGAR
MVRLAYVNRLLETRATDETYASIDDPRNGLLLSKTLHLQSEKGTNVYIRTPIPGIIQSSDLHLNCPPQQDILTVHYIHGDVYDPALTMHIPPNACIVTPGDTDTAPSHVLLDAVYGAHLFNKFGDDNVAMEMFPNREEQFYGRVKRAGSKGEDEWEKEMKEKEMIDQKTRDQADQVERRPNMKEANKGVDCYNYDSDLDLEIWTPPQTFKEASPMDKLLMIRSQYVTFVHRPSVEIEDEQGQSPLQKEQFEGKAKDIDSWRHDVIPSSP